jgi:hypothetical protein
LNPIAPGWGEQQDGGAMAAAAAAAFLAHPRAYVSLSCCGVCGDCMSVREHGVAFAAWRAIFLPLCM